MPKKKSDLDLKDLRKMANAYDNKITAEYVANKLGITTRAFYLKEAGAKIWDTELITLKKLYGVTYEELESAILASRK